MGVNAFSPDGDIGCLLLCLSFFFRSIILRVVPTFFSAGLFEPVLRCMVSGADIQHTAQLFYTQLFKINIVFNLVHFDVLNMDICFSPSTVCGSK